MSKYKVGDKFVLEVVGTYEDIYKLSDGRLCTVEDLDRSEQIEGREKAKEEIQVGDVVQSIYNPDVKVLITRRYEDEHYNGIDGSGATFSTMYKKHWKKTGLHYDIENILEKFKEES